MVKRKRMGIYKPIERKSKPKNSIKTGETKNLLFYTKGNRTYYVFKKKKQLSIDGMTTKRHMKLLRQQRKVQRKRK